jgi:hypothetical protein
MSQNVWATIMPFGPVTNFLLAPKKKFRASQRLVLISGTVHVLNRVFHHQKYFPNEIQWHLLIKQAKKKGRRKKK